MTLDANRRELLLAPLIATLALKARDAPASPLNPAETIIALPADLHWISNPGAQPQSVDQCSLFGDLNADGLYYTLVRWWPGYMSGPHSYATDRLCVVVSGVWWCNSGADFDPASCVPVPSGSFVRRVARTWHYDGAPRGESEPAVIAICGLGPVDIKLADPSQPLVRRV
jgi:hypothetical protein